jgi:hypothetical protein
MQFVRFTEGKRPGAGTPGRNLTSKARLVNEIRGGVGSDLCFKLFDFDGDDFVLDFGIHRCVLLLVKDLDRAADISSIYCIK